MCSENEELIIDSSLLEIALQLGQELVLLRAPQQVSMSCHGTHLYFL